MPSSPSGPSGHDSAMLLEGARRGSLADLGVLFQAARPYLLRVAAQELDSDLKAKVGGSDLVQQSFLEAQRSLATFRGATLADFVGWMRGILKHNIADVQRRYQATQMRRTGREEPLCGEVIDPEDTPMTAAVRHEEAFRVDAALGRMSDDHRQVILLRNRERLGFAEIGALLGRSEDAAQKLWARAVHQLRAELEGGADERRR